MSIFRILKVVLNVSFVISCRCERAAELVKCSGSLTPEVDDSDTVDDEDKLDDEDDGSFDDENIQYDPTRDANEGGREEEI